MNEIRAEIGDKGISINVDETIDRRDRYMVALICGKINIESSHSHLIACKEYLLHIWSNLQYR